MICRDTVTCSKAPARAGRTPNAARSSTAELAPGRYSRKDTLDLNARLGWEAANFASAFGVRQPESPLCAGNAAEDIIERVNMERNIVKDSQAVPRGCGRREARGGGRVRPPP